MIKIINQISLKLGFSFILILVSAVSLFAQKKEIQFEHISTNDGLSHSTVYCIMQDSYGFMWFGTQNGLNKYDGYNFTVYKNIPFDSLSLSDNWVQSLLEAKDRTIWVGTHSGGIFEFDRDKKIFINHRNEPGNSNSLINDRIWDLLEDNKGNIWIGTSAGLDKYDVKNKKFTHFLSDEITSLINNAVNSIHQDKNGMLWLATWGAGLIKFDPSSGKIIRTYTFENHPKKLRYVSNKIKVVFEDREGVFWLATSGDGLIRFNPGTGKYKYFVNDPDNKYSIDYDYVLSIIEDEHGNLWLGTHDGGLNEFNKSENKFYHFLYNPLDPYSLSNDWVPALCEDRSGIIWLGTDKGVDKFQPGSQVFKTLRHIENFPNSLSSDDVHSVLEDSDGIIWIGTWNGGLNRYNPSTKNYKTYYNTAEKNSLPNDIVLCMMEDSDKQLWFGTYNGLARYDRKNQDFKIYKSTKGDSTTLSFNDVSTLCEDSSGYLWVGTWGGGLNRMDRKTGIFKQYLSNPDHSNGLNDQIITCLFVSKNGTMYIGTAAGGLHIYLRNFDKFFSFKFDPADTGSISSNSINCITEDQEGMIWIGTAGGGLNKFNPLTKKFDYISDKDGLADNAITAILIDDRNNFWLSTSKGLTCYNPNNLQIINYDYTDGIGNTQFVNAASKGSDGKLMFGGKNGVTFFYPSISNEPDFNPSLVVLGFNIFDQPLKLGKDVSSVNYVELNYTDNTFSIDFAALSASRPDKIRYAYRLKGLDNNWVISDKRRTAYYTNLDPGTYTFHIKASLDGKNWIEKKDSLTVYIIPPFWQRWWFIILSVLLFGLIVYSIYQYRVNSLLKIERLRTRIASDLHDELASNLSSIAMFGNIIQQENQEKKSPPHELLDRIINLSQESVVSIREIIWAINPKVETIQNLLIKIRDSIVVSCRAKNIKLEFDIPDEQILSTENLSPEIRRDLWMLLKEVLMNSIKHSCCTELKLIALYDGHLMRIVIKDNGKGFNKDEKYSGHGLVNIKRRAASLKADLEISSEKNEGTTVVLSFKV